MCNGEQDMACGLKDLKSNVGWEWMPLCKKGHLEFGILWGIKENIWSLLSRDLISSGDGGR